MGSDPESEREIQRVVERDARRNPKCPECGLGLLPGARFCPRCGATVPDLGPTTEQVEAEQQRRRWRLAVWFLDLCPGVLSWRVMAAAGTLTLVAALIALTMGTFSAWTRYGGYAAAVGILTAAGMGTLALLTLYCGIAWVLTGAVQSPLLAFHELKARQWVVLLVLLVIAVRLFLLVRALLH